MTTRLGDRSQEALAATVEANMAEQFAYFRLSPRAEVDESPEVLRYLAGEPEFDQLLAHALVYRLVTEIVMRAGTAGIDAAARAAQPVINLVLARLALRDG